jgi:hypothetical protein
MQSVIVANTKGSLLLAGPLFLVQVEKAMANVGAILAEMVCSTTCHVHGSSYQIKPHGCLIMVMCLQVEGKISTDLDPRLAHDKCEEFMRTARRAKALTFQNVCLLCTYAQSGLTLWCSITGLDMSAAKLVLKAKSLRNLYQELRIPYNRLLFRVPATYAGLQVGAGSQCLLHVHHVVVLSLSSGAIRSWAAVNYVDRPLSTVSQAAKELEDAGIATHVHMVFR